MKHLWLIAPAAAVVMASVSAHADERWPRWYLGLSGGVSFIPDTDIKGAETGKVSYNTGGMGTVSLGYMPAFNSPFFNNMRIEAELGYHNNDLDKSRVNASPVASNGSLQSISYMGNLYYDFRNQSQWTPYLGAGAGGARVNISRKAGIGVTDSSASVFAYQFMAGLAYSPTSLPNTMWSIGYRYFVESNPSFSTTAGNIKLDDIQTHNIEAGVKFRF